MENKEKFWYVNDLTNELELKEKIDEILAETGNFYNIGELPEEYEILVPTFDRIF